MLIVPMLSSAQLQSNTSKKDTTSDPKAMDLPKRKNSVTKIKPDATVKSELGEQPTELIAKAKVVRAYEVETFLSDNPMDEVLEGFKVVQMEELTKKQSAYIKEVILSDETYFFTEDKKQCLFLPKLGLQFIDGNDTANVLISFKCDFARFYHNESITLHSDYGHENLKAFFHDVFPLDLSPDYRAQTVALATNIEKPVYYTVQLGDGWVALAQKATNTLNEQVTVDDLCKWNDLPTDLVKANKYFLMKGKTIIVGFKEEEEE